MIFSLKTNTELKGVAPDEILIFPAGEVKIIGSPSALMDVLAVDNILSHIKLSNADMVIDYEHQTLYGGEAPAAGWLKEFRWEPEVGFFGKCEWTERARKYIENREYRYFSPVFDVDRETNRIMRLYNVGLTNQPRMQNIEPLVAKKEVPDMSEKEEKKVDEKKSGGKKPSMPNLRKRLGFEDDIPDMIVEQKLLAILDEYDKIKDRKAAKAVLDALGMNVDASESEIVAKVHVLANKPDLTSDMMALKSQIKALEEERDRREFSELLKKGVTEGKIIPADAQNPESWVCKLDKPTLESYIAQAPVIVPVAKMEVAKVDPNKSLKDFMSEQGFDVSDEDIAKYGE